LEGAETSPLLGIAEEGVALIRSWRDEIADQWQPAELQLNPQGLVTAMEDWGKLGLEPLQMLWAILGEEWLLRARRMTRSDFEALLERMRKAHLRGSDDPDEAALLIECAEPMLWRRLKSRRYLVSHRTALAPWTWGLGSSDSPPERRERKSPRQLLPTRQGPIPNLGPVLAGILVHGIAEDLAGKASEAQDLGTSVTGWLLNRTVEPFEFQRWMSELDFQIPDPRPGLSESERRRTLRTYLVFRFRRMYASMRDDFGWKAFRDEAHHNPFFVFAPAGDLSIARALYTVHWSEPRPGKVGIGAGNRAPKS
jgi:hypothetical protein